MIEVVLNKPNVPAPARDSVRYVVAANGIFLQRRCGLYTSTTRVDRAELTDLEELSQTLHLHTPKLPAAMMRDMLNFFIEGHALHDGEVALILLYNPEQREFKWHCPIQTVKMYKGWGKRKGRWRADMTIHFQVPLELEEGWQYFGDAHLHPHGISACASHVDKADDIDGLHIIAAKVNSNKPEYGLTFVMDGVRFKCTPEYVLEDPSVASDQSPIPEGWLGQIRVVKEKPYQYQPSTSTWKPLASGGYYKETKYGADDVERSWEHLD